MASVQVIGLPGSGKTTVIKQFLAVSHKVKYLDLCRYVGFDKEKRLIQEIETSKLDTVVESACGLPMLPSLTIRLETPIEEILGSLEDRDGMVDLDNLHRLQYEMISADVVVNSHRDLFTTLCKHLRTSLFNVYQHSP